MRVFCAGLNIYGQFSEITDNCLETFKDFQYNNANDLILNHTNLIIKTNNSKSSKNKIFVHGFVENKSHQIKELNFNDNVDQISLYDSKSLFLCTNKNVYTTENNFNITTSLPNFIKTETDPQLKNDYIVKISTGSVISCMSTKKGNIFSSLSKVDCETIPNIKDIKCGIEHCLILTENGLVYSFGCGSRGQLGHGNVENLSEPKLIESLTGIKINKISCGGWHSAALSSEGDLYVWGCNTTAQLGLKVNNTDETEHKNVSIMASPVVLNLDLNVVDVACGGKHTIILLDDSKLYGFGWNKYCQLGFKSSEEIINSLTCLYDFSSFNVEGLRCSCWNTAALVNEKR